MEEKIKFQIINQLAEEKFHLKMLCKEVQFKFIFLEKIGILIHQVYSQIVLDQ